MPSPLGEGQVVPPKNRHNQGEVDARRGKDRGGILFHCQEYNISSIAFEKQRVYISQNGRRLINGYSFNFPNPNNHGSF